MTYGILKQKIFALLDIDGNDIMTEGSAIARIASALPYTVDAVSRKVALHLKNILCCATLRFEKGSVGVQAALPESAFGVQKIVKNGRSYGAESFTLIGKNIIFFERGEGDFTVFYYAYPDVYTDETGDETEIPFDDLVADIVAYGTAGELSHTIYPSDMVRYMRLMTEYDERIAVYLPRTGEDTVRNSLFSKRKGVSE